ncbi:putative chaperone protein [Dyadobacter jejuensis]|uniref:Putative chaperone protein n=1 Tax=Dyadobacter jejuensis TaxID=1082580 RepID=A0A316AML9_9BACT|nr:Hsp70 family protein [Dyadobacter jejuensis]PWJ58816.1 putative chaperone protein [Dyadobacter jejuensis]
MSPISCGIDFGTSNSSIALADANQVSLVETEAGQYTIPSAMFFLRKDNTAFYGREAMELFLSKRPGRLMRSLKRVLGTPVMRQGTMVNGEVMKFDQIITAFLEKIKTKAELQAGRELEAVTMGRPVHFTDNNPEADRRAEDELKAIANRLGFKSVSFQFEPIAAAFAHENGLTSEKLALVVDLGGGTSDFTVIKLSNKNLRKPDRSSDILANTGIRIGGNDFDKDLSLAAIMPILGYRSTYGVKNLEVPPYHYHDLSEWSKVNMLYTNRIVFQVKQLLFESHDKTKYKRLLQVLEEETGHSLLAATEETKIALTNEEQFQTSFAFLDPELSAEVKRQTFNTAIDGRVQKISQTALECVKNAGTTPDQIELVILTGGTTEVPKVQQQFQNLFPNAEVSGENKLSSVGLGLAYDSRNKFG